MISKQRLPRSNATPLWGWLFAAVEVAAAYRLGQLAGWWWLGAVIVAAIELRPLWAARRNGAGRLAALWAAMPGLIMALSMTLIIAVVPRQATQVVVALLFAAWLIWRVRDSAKAPLRMVQLLVVQAAMFEAIFLMAAIWLLPSFVVLLMVWAGAYLSVYSALIRREDPAAGVMAATWGVVATEIAWILQKWLITYTMHGGYVLVPQPALILTALAYVFGSIFTSSRQGNLSRGRLAEYMVIALVLVMIVVAGSFWRAP